MGNSSYRINKSNVPPNECALLKYRTFVLIQGNLVRNKLLFLCCPKWTVYVLDYCKIVDCWFSRKAAMQQLKKTTGATVGLCRFKWQVLSRGAEGGIIRYLIAALPGGRVVRLPPCLWKDFASRHLQKHSTENTVRTYI